MFPENCLDVELKNTIEQKNVALKINTESVLKASSSDRVAGVLMPISALPSQDGAGTFGKNAYKFVDIIADMGMKVWQILPLNPLGYGNSPYQPISSCAGDDIYIDLDMLAHMGYISRERNAYIYKQTGKVDYVDARAYREPYLKQAYQAFKNDKSMSKEFDLFCEQDWVRSYGTFVTFKKHNNDLCWNEWPQNEADWTNDKWDDLKEYREEIDYVMFLQFIFKLQWKALKDYANQKGILIMGDVPFYVGLDSVDVWQNREDFLLDAKGKPTFIAGVPPDYFSQTGQRWGNPIYNWERLKENDYDFWINRLSYSGEMYDIIRVDHFRAFDTFWKIPASCPTAVDGQWVEAPGYELLEKVKTKLPKLWIIAEDLGDLRPEVITLRDHFGLSGMFILEFSLLSDKLPVKNQVAYTGTHDNQTVKGWYINQDTNTRRNIDTVLKNYGKPGDSVNSRMLHFIFESDAKLAIAPIADILECDDYARINAPGTVGSPNWEWRLDSLSELNDRVLWVKQMLINSDRILKEV